MPTPYSLTALTCASPTFDSQFTRMGSDFFQDIPKTRQYIICVVSIAVVTLLSLALHDLFGYRLVAFMPLVSMALLAMFLNIVDVFVDDNIPQLKLDFELMEQVVDDKQLVYENKETKTKFYWVKSE